MMNAERLFLFSSVNKCEFILSYVEFHAIYSCMGVYVGMDSGDMSLPILLPISNNLATLTPGKISAELPGLCIFCKKVHYYDE